MISFEAKREQKSNRMNNHICPKFVNVLTDDNRIEKMKYVDIFEHENNIISGNIWAGIKARLYRV